MRMIHTYEQLAALTDDDRDNLLKLAQEEAIAAAQYSGDLYAAAATHLILGILPNAGRIEFEIGGAVHDENEASVTILRIRDEHGNDLEAAEPDALVIEQAESYLSGAVSVHPDYFTGNDGPGAHSDEFVLLIEEEKTGFDHRQAATVAADISAISPALLPADDSQGGALDIEPQISATVYGVRFRVRRPANGGVLVEVDKDDEQEIPDGGSVFVELGDDIES